MTSNNALRLLIKSDFVVKDKWTELISHLVVSPEERRRLETIASRDQDFNSALKGGIQWWIENSTPLPSWEELILAVENCGDEDVATKLKRHLYINNEGMDYLKILQCHFVLILLKILSHVIH